MAAYLNRTISLVTGQTGPNNNDDKNSTATDTVDDSRHNLSLQTSASSTSANFNPMMYQTNDKSPLQIFVRAKKKINDIYGEIEEYVLETTTFINALHADAEIVDKAERELFESYVFKVAAIREVLQRDHMKVAFFGRTSNGKSSVINAMLREKILPSGIGHTTNCFCQVEGSDGGEAYLMKEGSDEKLNVVNIKQLANALCQEKLCESSLVRIFWPRERCSLLRDDVVFVDSPGVDVSANLDDWIDNHCLNADVFVLVLNAESTMTRAEKQFFHTVSQKLSKPNIFILNNRWDASANEPEFQESELAKVKSQHTERCIDFLTKELKVSNEKEAAERVFFVSARETLQARIEESKGNPPHLGAIAEGFQIRYFEFQDFERKFEECISQSAVKTKFQQHSSRGKSVSGDMRSMLDNIYERITIFRNLKQDQKNLLTERIQGTETQMMQVTREMKMKIHNMVEEVEEKVSKALNEEIWRLGVLIDEFNMPFHPERLVLNIYKKELNAHVESGLGSNLRARLSMALAMNVESAQNEMTDRMHALVPNEQLVTNSSKMVVRTQPFEMLYSLNCQNLCADFQEDLEFKFSWGIAAMIQRFTGKVRERSKKQTPALINRQSSIGHTVVTPVSTPVETTPVCLLPTPGVVGGITPEQLSIISRFAMSSIGSQGTVGGLVVAGVVLLYRYQLNTEHLQMLKTIGWRVLVGIGALYGCIYLYERLSWTNSAKERTFKGQYVRHATKKLKMIVDLTSANCSHQVQQELSSTFARLCRTVDTATTDMNEELKTLESQLNVLEANQKQLKLLRNKANYIQNELDIFEHNYIAPQ
ncbi:transmembrane GTPase Marf isoform X1 [Drosophila albomicans]|uniref:Transmembrane GTPase Marf isoform X1 n=1 Tax=Drosophila albomicans TaxID=7291 RepID=A0A6P8Y6T5_DROAB|nr:transmembrane GTPase Marf isoform X1 [Drosophila albomicans]XP_034104227.1 transmembrane GTPase Marf isoform X1 [Drosophila albomicans]